MMKKWKIALTVLLCLVVGAVGMACGGRQTPSGGDGIDDEVTTQNVTIKIQSAAPLKDTYKSILRTTTDKESLIYKQALFTQYVVEGFKELYPNITLEFYEDGWGTQLQTTTALKLENWANGGKMDRDILIGESEMGYYAKNNVFADLGKSDFADVNAGPVGDVTVGDKLYAVPMCTGIFGLQYNTTILKEAGILEADMAPKTWDQLLANCKKVSEYAAAHDKTYCGIVINGISGLSSAYRALPFMRQAGGDFVDDSGNPAVNTAGNLRAYEYLRKLAQYTTASLLNEGSEDSLQNQFCKDNVAAYMVEGQWAMATANEDIKAAALPTETAGSKMGNCFVGNVLFGVFTGSEHKPEAKAFLKYLTSPAVQLKLYELDGRLPISNSVLQGDEVRAVHPALNPYIDALNVGGFSGGLPYFDQNANTIWNKWGVFVKKVYNSTEDIAPLADALQNDWIEQLK